MGRVIMVSIVIMAAMFCLARLLGGSPSYDRNYSNSYTGQEIQRATGLGREDARKMEPAVQSLTNTCRALNKC